MGKLVGASVVAVASSVFAMAQLSSVGTIIDDDATVAINGEFRCDDLGANCVCAEPLNTATLTGPWNSAWYNPDDSTSKQCSMASTGYAIETNVTPVVYSDATALAALPAGHSISYFVGRAGAGIFKMGKGNVGASYVKRYSVRWYIYYSPDFEFFGDGVCENTKVFQAGGTPLGMPSSGVIQQTSFGAAGHTYNGGVDSMGDCCTAGPPGASGGTGFGNTTKAGLRGDWHRFEFVVTNRAGGSSPNGIVYELFWKNITDGTAEVQIIDTSVACPTCSPNPAGLGEDDLTPGSRVDELWVNLYRQGPCGGWEAVSHILYAGWDTDTGQRIGSAKEIEGVAGVIDP